MALLRRLLSKTRVGWTGMVPAIAEELDAWRRTWFGWCLDGFQHIKVEEHYSFNIAKGQLADEGELLVTACQLHLISSFVTHRDYLPVDKTRDFVWMLARHVWGDRAPDHLPYTFRYGGLESGEESALYRFCSDLAEYITGSKHACEVATLLAPGVPTFVAATFATVAYAFGDDKIVTEIEGPFTTS